RFALVTAPAGGSLLRGQDATELRQDPGRPDRVVKELLAEVALRLGRLEARVGAGITAVGKSRLGQIRIVCRDHQFLDATDLPINEPAQLDGAVTLISSSDSAAEQGNGERRERAAAAGRPVLRRRSVCLSIRGPCKLSSRFVHHVRVPPEVRCGGSVGLTPRDQRRDWRQLYKATFVPDCD